MKLITIDMSEGSVLLVGKVIVRVKKGVFDVALISHVTENELNNMSLFDVRIFAFDKENVLIKIYDNSHPCPDTIKEEASIDRIDKGVSYGLYDLIKNDSDF